MDVVFADFESLVNQAFDVQAEQEGEIFTQLTLRETSRLPHGHPSRPEPFRLLFEGPKDRPLDQSTYLLVHPVLGEQEIFIVPVGESGEVRRYEAIFN